MSQPRPRRKEPVALRAVRRYGLDGQEALDDELVVEEPLEIRLGDEPLAVLMRTPGHDIDLAVGFLFSEGILRDPAQLLVVEYCADVTADAEGNVVRVRADGADRDAVDAARRQVYASSSCGLCGKATLEAIRLLAPSMTPPGPCSAGCRTACGRPSHCSPAPGGSTRPVSSAGTGRSS